jgi:hypothetical protein
MQLHKNIEIIFDKKYIIVLFKNKMFLKQAYIKNEKKDYTFFFVLLILSRYGLIDFNND